MTENRRRREFLLACVTAAGSAGVAGCLEGNGNPDPNSGNEDADSTEPGDSGPDGAGEDEMEEFAESLRVEGSVVEFENDDVTAASFPVSFRTDDGAVSAVGFVEAATDGSPAKVGVALRNTNDYDHVFRSRLLPPFDTRPVGYPEDRSGDADAVYLVPTEEHGYADGVPEVGRDGEGDWRLEDSIDDWVPETVELGAEEVAYAEYAFVGHPDASNTPITTEEYRFSGRGGTLRFSVWETGAPGPVDGSMFGGEEVPEVERVDRDVSWYHEADEETEVYLKPSAEEVETPARIEYELVNRKHERISGNPDGWGLYKLVDGDWHHVAPAGVHLPLSYVYPGDTEESTLRMRHDEAVSCSGERTADRLGGGTYAYVVHFGREEERCAALVEFDAPELELEKPDGAAVEQGEGDDELVVTSERWREAKESGEIDEDSMLPIVFERVDDAVDAEDAGELIAEQVYRGRREYLPHSIPFLKDEDVDSVVVKSDPGLRSSRFRDEGTVYRYDGETYRARYEMEQESD